MKHLIRLLFLLAAGPLSAQNQEQLPLASLRYIHSWGPGFDAFNPVIAVYKNGSVIFKARRDSSSCTGYCFNYYQAWLAPSAIDSIVSVFHINEAFDTLKASYDPIREQTGFALSDAGMLVLSVHDRSNRSVNIMGGGWAWEDSLYQYNPAPVKKLSDYLESLHQQLLASGQFRLWEPSVIELVRIPVFKGSDKSLYRDVPATPLGKKYEQRKWSSMKERDPGSNDIEYLRIRDKAEIRELMAALRQEKDVVVFKKKRYLVSYTFSYDHVPYYFNYGRQMKEM